MNDSTPDMPLLDENKRLSMDLVQSQIENNILKRKLAKLEHKYSNLASSLKESEYKIDLEEIRDDMQKNYLFYKLLTDKCPISICVFNSEMKYVMGSSLFLSLLGCKNARRLKNKDFRDVFHDKVDTDWMRRTMQNCQKTINSRQTLEYNEKILFTNKDEIYAHVTIVPATDKNNESLGILLIISDITELNRLKDSIESYSVEMSNFLSNMNHGIRTPLNAIQGLSELLMLTDLDDVQMSYSENILNASKALRKSFTDLIDYASSDTDKQTIIYTPYDFASFIDIISNMANIMCADKNIDFITDIDPSIPAYISGYDGKIKQVLYNLIDNAVKFTSEGYIKLTITSEQKMDKVRLCFSVTDTGGGIDEETLENLFAPFKATDTLRNATQEINGLGLSLSKKLVQLMNGEIKADSVVGKGTTITFWVTQSILDAQPIAEVKEPETKNVLLIGSGHKIESCQTMLDNLRVKHDTCCDSKAFAKYLENEKYTHLIYYYDLGHKIVENSVRLPDDILRFAIKDLRYAVRQPTPPEYNVLFESIVITDISRSVDRKASDSYRADNKNADEIGETGAFKTKNAQILVVDDSKTNLMVARDILQHYNCIVEPVETGSLAVKMSQIKKFDLIFMDHMMSDMDGVEAAKKIRLSGVNSDTPIIALTANALTGAKDYFLENEMNDLLLKPIGIGDLNKILAAWLPKEKLDFQNTAQLSVDDSTEKIGTKLSNVLNSFGIEPEHPISVLGGNVDSYLSILRTFLHSIPPKLQYFMNFGKTEKDMEILNIMIHETKCSVENIGAGIIYTQACELESIAADSDFRLVTPNLSRFCALLLDFYGKAYPLLPAEAKESEPAPAIMDADELKKMMMKLQVLISNLDAEEAVSLIKKTLKHKHSAEIQLKLKQLRINIENYDYDISQQNIISILDLAENVAGTGENDGK